MKEESISDANDVTSDTFSHTSNTQIENVNTILTSEKIDKSDDLPGALKDLKISDTKYYESDTETANDTQGDPTRVPETITHTSKGNEKVTLTIDRDFVKKY